MYKVLEYLKYIGIFFLFIIGIAIINSLLGLIGIHNPFTTKLAIILTALSFFIVSALASHKTNEKGYILGMKLGLFFIILLLFINLIIFKSKFSIDRFIYYVILLASSILGGSFGKNLRIKKLKS